MAAPAIVLRWSPIERTLRSTGELAGILVLAWPDQHPTFAIDRGWEPRPESAETVISSFEEGISPLAEPVSIEEVVEACFSREECKALWLFTVQVFHAGAQVLVGQQAFEKIRELVDFAEETAAALDRRLGDQ